jgi:hypothetical protein
MNFRSVFSHRTDPQRLDEQEARNDGGSEGSEQHANPLEQPPFRPREFNENGRLDGPS